MDKVIVLYKGRVVFQQYIPKKYKRFGIKIYKLCDSLGYTYDMSMYLGKQRQHATAQITAMHGTELQLIWRVEGLGHKIISPCLLCLMICSNEKSVCVCVCNSSPWQAWNALRYWTKISENEKGRHSDMSQGNRKGCSLKRQAGCVHSDKHSLSSFWRKFHSRIWLGYQTSCCRRLQSILGVCGQVSGQQLWNCPQNMEVDQETVFSPNVHDHSERISYTQVMWRQNDAQKSPWNSRSQTDYSFARRKCDS